VVAVRMRSSARMRLRRVDQVSRDPGSACAQRAACVVGKVNACRTFADRDFPLRWYVVLPVDRVWSLVWWEEGKVKTIALAHMKRKRVRLTSYEFPLSQLLMRWGLTSKELDRYLEAHVYKWNRDILKVRATRKPLTGKTLEIVRPVHKVHDVRVH